ncbi:MAG: type II toxin-antitoxin system VapC family toxin [Mesorhizobium sp.]
MYVLDTNVVSESIAAKPSPAVTVWLQQNEPDRYFVTAITKAEMLFGVSCLPPGQRRANLELLIEHVLARSLRNDLLAFGSAEADHYADLSAHRRKIGRPISQLDAQIAAIARARGFAVVTRNVGDFEHCGIAVINPWESP